MTRFAMMLRRNANRPGGLFLRSGKMIAIGLGGQILLLVSGPLVARMLGVTDRGYLAGLLIWPIMLTAAGSLGLPAACTYFLTREREHHAQILGEACRAAILQALLASILVGIALYVWTRGTPPEVQFGALPAALMLPAGLAIQYSQAVLQGQHRFTAFNVVRILPPALYLLTVVILFAVGERRIFAIVVAWTASYVIAAAVGTWTALRGSHIDWRGAGDLRRPLWRFGLRGYLGALTPIETLKIDQAAAAILLPPAALGLYVVAAAFSNLPRFLSRSVVFIAYPTVSAQVDAAVARRLVWRFFWGTSFLVIVCVVLLVLALPLLLPFFFGHDFASAIPIARILVIGSGLVAMRLILVEGLRGLGRPEISTISELSMYPWLAVGAPLLMHALGIQGLALAVSCGFAISFVAAIAVALWSGVASGRRNYNGRLPEHEARQVPDTDPPT